MAPSFHFSGPPLPHYIRGSSDTIREGLPKRNLEDFLFSSYQVFVMKKQTFAGQGCQAKNVVGKQIALFRLNDKSGQSALVPFFLPMSYRF